MATTLSPDALRVLRAIRKRGLLAHHLFKVARYHFDDGKTMSRVDVLIIDRELSRVEQRHASILTARDHTRTVLEFRSGMKIVTDYQVLRDGELVQVNQSLETGFDDVPDRTETINESVQNYYHHEDYAVWLSDYLSVEVILNDEQAGIIERFRLTPLAEKALDDAR